MKLPNFLENDDFNNLRKKMNAPLLEFNVPKKLTKETEISSRLTRLEDSMPTENIGENFVKDCPKGALPGL